MNINSKWKPIIIAVAIALIAVIYYIASGRSSLDLNTRELGKTGNVAAVESAEPQKVQIKCKNGETYEIVFDKAQQNYDHLVFDACGAEGTQESGSL
jgi:spore coat protein U-like protein